MAENKITAIAKAKIAQANSLPANTPAIKIPMKEPKPT